MIQKKLWFILFLLYRYIQIAVNGTHFSEFRHRIPFTAARYIHIGGNVQIHSITLEGDAPVVSTPLASAPPLHSCNYLRT